MPRKMSSMKEVYNTLYMDEDNPDDIAEVQDTDDTDLDRLAKVLGLERLPPYKANHLYLGQIGSYEVWKGRTGYGVWTDCDCHALGLHSGREAANAAHRLNNDAMTEYAGYLKIRQGPSVASRKSVKKLARSEKSC